MRTEEPLCRPKMTSWMTNTGMLAVVTAAKGVSPSIPTIRVSTRPRDVVTRFCRIMGMARITTSL